MLELDSILCNVHGKMIHNECNICKSVATILGPDRCRSHGLVLSPDAPIPEASACLEKFQKQGSKKATLHLSQAALDYGRKVYFSKPMQKSKFEDIIKDYLFLSPEQNEVLMANLELETPLANKLKGAMLDFKNQMIKIAKNPRIIEQIPLETINKLDLSVGHIWPLGAELGLTFPEVAPEKNLLGPSAIQDPFAYTDANVFPLPDEVDNDLFEGVKGLSEEQKLTIQENIRVQNVALEGLKLSYIEP